MARNYPTSVAQNKVLSALGLTAEDYPEAEKVLAAHGIAVSSRRVGRSSEPVVTRLAATFGGWNPGGDGESYEVCYKDIDLSPVSQWMQ
jgi:hypothetical protein